MPTELTKFKSSLGKRDSLISNGHLIPKGKMYFISWSVVMSQRNFISVPVRKES